MTAYNRENYIAEAIESILAQTFKDFELIIVDDRSKDRTLEIARRYTTDARVQVHVNEKNLGDYPNRNRAAELARGRYLKYLDADDIMYPDCLEIMTEQMERFSEAAIGIESEAEHRWPRPFPVLLSPAEAYREHFLRQGILSEGPTAIIIRTAVFREAGGFSQQRHISDTELWLRIARHWPLVLCCCGLTWWRQHAEQESVSEKADSSAIVRRYLLDVKALMAKDCPMGLAEQRLALRRIQKRYLKRIAGLIRHGRLGLAWSLGRAYPVPANAP